MIEASMVLYESNGYFEVVSMTRGGPASVEFDFEAVWAFRRRRFRFDPKRLHWVHVHPQGFGPGNSMQDVLCAQALELAFGKGTIQNFGIVCFDNADLNDFDGNMAWYYFENGELHPHDQEFRRIPTIMKLKAAMLKALSYAR
jgi:hypothetical protein